MLKQHHIEQAIKKGQYLYCPVYPDFLFRPEKIVKKRIKGKVYFKNKKPEKADFNCANEYFRIADNSIIKLFIHE